MPAVVQSYLIEPVLTAKPGGSVTVSRGRRGDPPHGRAGRGRRATVR
jgi:hypothetical protein